MSEQKRTAVHQARQQLMDRIYRIVSNRTIDSQIKKLHREIAGVSPEKELIHSVYGVGYKCEAG